MNIALIDLKNIDDTPRLQDLKLASALNFGQGRDLRKLIKRHATELGGYGEVCAMLAQTSERGGRPSVEYWLNEQQALLLCMFARTDRAAQVRAQLIGVFTAWRQGRLQGHATAQAAGAPLWGEGTLDEYSAKLATLRECRLINGRAAAARLWHQLGMPSSVGEAGNVSDGRTDVLARFLADRTKPEACGRVQSSVLYAAFDGWCRLNGVSPWSQKAFSMALKQRGYQDFKTSVVYFVGLSLTSRPVGDDQGRRVVSMIEGGSIN